MIVKQAANVLDLLEFFARHRKPASLGEIAKAMNWPRSSTFNLLQTLAGRGFLYEPRARAGFYPSPLWSSLSSQVDAAEPVPEQLRKLLHALVERTGETTFLAAASSGCAVYVDVAESPSPIRYSAAPGKLVPLHVTATGRALLAQMTPGERIAVLRRATFERYTPATLMSVNAVEKEIQKSLERGWFQGNAEYTPELGGISMSLALPHRQFAVTVAGPMFRVKDRGPELAKIMKDEIAKHAGALMKDHVPKERKRA